MLNLGVQKSSSLETNSKKIVYNVSETAINNECFFLDTKAVLYQPINTNVTKPSKNWELSQSNEEQEIMVLA